MPETTRFGVEFFSKPPVEQTVAESSLSSRRTGRRHLHGRLQVLLLLKLPVLERPEAFEEGDHVGDVLIAELAVERRHGQLGCFVEWIAQAIADDHRQLLVGMAPGMARV